MINRNQIKWLQKELPNLVDREIISEFQSERIFFHYKEEFKAHKIKFLKLLWGFVGTMMAILLAIIFLCH